MVVIYGTKTKLKFDKSLGVQTCPNCGNYVELSVAHESKYAHIYHIPLMPLPGWKLKFCPNCGVAQKLTKDEFKSLKAYE